MRLLGDRFCLDGPGTALDLATGSGARVWQLGRIEGKSLVAWLDRCDRMMNQEAGTGAALLDYGLTPDGRRFVARPAAKRPSGPSTTLRRCCPILADSAGIQRHRSPSDLSASLARQLVDVLEDQTRAGVIGVQWLAAEGQPLDAMLRTCIRAGRLSGFVPLAAELVARAASGVGGPLPSLVSRMMMTRHILVVDDQRGVGCHDGAALAGAMLRLGHSNSRPHAWLTIRLAAALAGSFELAEPLTQMTLVPDWWRTLPRLPVAGCRPHAEVVSRVAEAAAPCWPAARSGTRPDPSPVAQATLAQSAGTQACPVPAAIAQSHSLESRGRHAAAMRVLRRELGEAVRRGDHRRAGAAAFALARILLRRGHTSDAERMATRASEWLERTGGAAEAIRASCVAAGARQLAGRIAEAESLFRACWLAARRAGLRERQDASALGLAECLLERGRFDEARAWLARAGDGDCVAPDAKDDEPYSLSRQRGTSAAHDQGHSNPALMMDERSPTTWARKPEFDARRSSAATWLALATQDYPEAARLAGASVSRAHAGASRESVAIARCASAAVHAALGDLEALAVDLSDGLRACREARVPVLARRLRSEWVAGLRRAGHTKEADRLASRLARARAAPSLDQLSVAARMRAAAEKVARGSAPATVTAAGMVPQQAGRWLADRISELLGAACLAGPETSTLTRVAELLHTHVCASGVAILLSRGSGLVPVASVGTRVGLTEIASRALDTGLLLPPERGPAGVEAASPIRSGAEVVGVVVVRWPITSAPDAAGTAAILGAAAAVAGPPAKSLAERSTAPSPGACAHALVGQSEAMENLRDAIDRAAGAPFPVLIEGESGTGKELVARALHRASPRRERRFCAVNCAALTDDLIEAELFGHTRGAFTGAVVERAGLFEEAHAGTLLLDEVGELSPRAQAKLLRALQEGEVRRLGENVGRPVDARIVAASNRPLRAEASAGRFRQDLLFRLEVVRIVVPPLRARVEDIPPLARHFWGQSTARLGSQATLAPATIATLARHDWPGNVRELQNVMAALAVASPRRGSVGPEVLAGVLESAPCQARGATLEEARRVFDQRVVTAALARSGGHKGRAATELGLSRQGLAKLIIRLGLTA